MKFNKLLTLFVLIIAIMAVNCDRQKADTNKLVTVNQQSLEKNTFINRFKLAKPYKENDEITSDIVKNFIDMYMVEGLLYTEEALNRGMENDQEYLDELKKIKRGIITQSNGVLFSNVVPNNFPVTDTEIDDFYNNLGVEIKIANITVNTKELADKIYKKLKHGDEFAQLASQYSHDIKSAKNDGIVDLYFSKGTFDPELENIAFALDKNEISKPIKTPYGYQIIKLLDKKEIAVKPPEDIQIEIISKIKQRKLLKYMENYTESLHDKYSEKFNDAAIQKILDNTITQNDFTKVNIDDFDDKFLTTNIVSYEGGALTVKEFCRDFNSGWTVFPLHNNEDVISVLKQLIIKDIMYLEALKLGLDQEPKLLKTMDKYRIERLKRYAMQKLLYEKIQIDERDVKDAYIKKYNNFDKEDFETKKMRLTNQIRQEQLNSKREQLLNELKTKYHIVYNEAAIRATVKELNQMKKEGK